MTAQKTAIPRGLTHDHRRLNHCFLGQLDSRPRTSTLADWIGRWHSYIDTMQSKKLLTERTVKDYKKAQFF